MKLTEEFSHEKYRKTRHKPNRQHIIIPILLTVATLMLLIYVLEILDKDFRYSSGSAIVFASFAASAFTLFMTPYARSSNVNRFIRSYTIAAILGEMGYLLTGTIGFYAASALTLFMVALLMFETDSMHPAAMGIAFAFVIYQLDYVGVLIVVVGVTVFTMIKVVLEYFNINP